MSNIVDPSNQYLEYIKWDVSKVDYRKSMFLYKHDEIRIRHEA